MKINTKTTNIEMTEAISNYVDKKILMLNKFFNDTEEVLVNVEVGKENKHHKSGDVFKAEIHIISGGKNYYATVDKDDLYAAIDEVKDEISSQLSKDKKKTERFFRQSGALVKNMIKGIKDLGGRGWRKIRKGRG